MMLKTLVSYLAMMVNILLSCMPDTKLHSVLFNLSLVMKEKELSISIIFIFFFLPYNSDKKLFSLNIFS